MNVGSLQAASSNQSWSTSKAQEREAEFLTLRLLSKHARIRLSPSPFRLNSFVGRVNYFAVAKSKGWFAAVTRVSEEEYKIILSSLEDLRNATPGADAEGEKDFTSKASISFSKPLEPTHVNFVRSDELLVVGFKDSSLAVYNAAQILSDPNVTADPLVQLPNTCGQGPIIQFLPNPGDLPDLVLILRETLNPNDASLEVLDVSQLRVVSGWKRGPTDATNPTAVSWSAKGKQLAIGMQSGDILTFAPSDVNVAKQTIHCPPQAENHRVSSLFWLSNTAFYAIYVPGASQDPEAAQKHIVIVHDAKANSSSSIELDSPYFPSPALRPPGAFAAMLRSWEPSSFLLFLSDGTSSDIGLVGCLTEGGNDIWANLSLEETSTPSVPLDKDSEDTVPLALELDTTYTEGGENKGKPVMFVYASDGTIQSWNVINEKGPYPGMTPVLTSPSSVASAPSMQQSVSSTEVAMDSESPEQATSSVQSQQKTGFSQFASPSFGSSSFGKTSTFPTPAAPSPKTGFGAFVSSSSFASPSFGFGSFASQTPSAFGSNATQSSVPTAPPPPDDAASPEADMAEADNESSMGGLSLGASNNDASDTRTNTMFGAFGTPSSAPPQTSSAFGSGTAQPAKGFGAFGGGNSAFAKPGGAFGAFSNLGGSSPSTASAGPSSQVSTPTFGGTGFGSAKPAVGFGQPAFGQSSFGTSPSFGSPSFGTTTFGKSAFGAQATPTTPSSNAFSAFATSSPSKGFGAFAQGGQSTFGSVSKASPSKSITMSTSSDDDQSAPTSDAAAGKQEEQASTGTAEKASAHMVNTFSPVKENTPTSSPEGSPSRSTIPDKADSLTKESPSDESKKESQQPALSLDSPSPSPFKSSGPSSGFGAFGNIASQPSPFKLAEGFGAFGSKSPQTSPFKPSEGSGTFGSTTPASSPFSSAKSASVSAFKSVSAFATGASSSPATGSTTPTFGSPSAVGSSPVFGKSSFGSPSFGSSPFGTTSSPSTKPPPSTGGGFSAFSGSSTGFGAFAGGKTTSFLGASKPTKPDNKSEDAPSESETTTKISDDRDEPEGSKVSKSEIVPEPSEDDDLPPTPSSHGTFDDEADEGGKDSLTESGFVVEPSDEEDANEEDEEEEEGVVHEDAEGFLSDSFSEGSEEDAGSDADAEERTPAPRDDEDNKSPESRLSTKPSKDFGKSPTKPLTAFGFKMPPADSSSKVSPFGPKSSSENVFGGGVFGAKPKEDAADNKPSAKSIFGKPTDAKPSAFSFGQSSGSSVFGNPKKPSEAPKQPSPELSTTPPGSPDKGLISPKPVAAGMASLGLGRPTSRPTKTSPLSTTPVTNNEVRPPLPASTPSFPKARPASPKTPFGQLPTPPIKAEPTTPSPFGTQTSIPLKSAPTFPPLTSSSTSPLPLSNAPFQITPMNSTVPFKFPPAPSASTQPAASGTLLAGNAPFIMPSAPPVMSPAITPSSLPLPKSGPLPTPTLFGQRPPPANPAGAAQPEPPQSQVKLQTQFDSAMQEDCQTLCILMAKEFEVLRKLAADATAFRERASKPALPKHTKQDLGDLAKWSMGDLDIFGKTVKLLESDILALYELQTAMKPLMREAESNLLKAETRKEEIVRFSKAKADPEFAKMLKSRTLGPEHVETQNQLRKQLRAINERVDQLEMHLKACKRKLEGERKGRPSIQPPSLDTVNRTYRNIDIAIEDQTDRIAALAARVSKLNLEAGSLHASPRRNTRGRFGLNDDDDDERRSVSSAGEGKRAWSGQALYRPEVAPSIAASTAAALNAERNAQRLKLALARARTEPLLNTQAVQPALPAPSLDSLRRSLAQSSSQISPPIPSSDSEPQDLFDRDVDSGPSSPGELRSGRTRKSTHQKSVPLGRTHQKVPSAIVSFDWGPMPSARPMTQLSSDLRGETR